MVGIIWNLLMNDKIKELKQQAMVLVDEGLGGGRFGLDEEKYAELIIKECFFVMNQLEEDIKHQFNWKKDEVIPTSGHIKKLKEHFGIE